MSLTTGGGTDLGKGAAIEFIPCGAQVVVAGRRPEVLEAAAAEFGDRRSCVAGDIRWRDGAADIVRSALERHGRLDLLLNNAGGQYLVPAEEITVMERVTRLNAGGTLQCARPPTSWSCACHDRPSGGSLQPGRSNIASSAGEVLWLHRSLPSF